MKLSVVIPAYNEEKGIKKAVRNINDYLKKQDYDYEIVVANDGSKDKTADAVRSLQNEITNLRLIDNKKNHGKGFVVKQGMLESRGEVRLFTDADNSTDISHLEKIWPEFEKGANIVIGSRDLPGSELDPPQPWYRQILGEAFGFATSLILGTWGIKDTQCGFKAMTAEAVEKIMPQITMERWTFDPEILVLAKRMKYKIKEIPVRWVNRGVSRVKFFGPNSMVNMLFNLLEIRRNLITKKYNL